MARIVAEREGRQAEPGVDDPGSALDEGTDAALAERGVDPSRHSVIVWYPTQVAMIAPRASSPSPTAPK
ncbi:hypothetical protein [Corynebacterium meridianum]|uniref:hypothetical protein n=1 Tax=Corynebacterium meridianum TaxID=2765363 RepID=UPI003AB96FAF